MVSTAATVIEKYVDHGKKFRALCARTFSRIVIPSEARNLLFLP